MGEIPKQTPEMHKTLQMMVDSPYQLAGFLPQDLFHRIIKKYTNLKQITTIHPKDLDLLKKYDEI